MLRRDRFVVLRESAMVNLLIRLAVVRAGQQLQLLLGSHLSDITNKMARQKKTISKRIGRPPTGVGTPILVRLHPKDLKALDQYRADSEGKPTRPGAIRRILAEFLKR
jgi:hypothetical protein